jgi:hypothetical protein
MVLNGIMRASRLAGAFVATRVTGVAGAISLERPSCTRRSNSKGLGSFVVSPASFAVAVAGDDGIESPLGVTGDTSGIVRPARLVLQPGVMVMLGMLV